MRIKLSPQYREDELRLLRHNDSLFINGEEFDFSLLPDGAMLPVEAISCPWVIDQVQRINGELILTLLLPLAVDASEAARFPADIVNPPNGEVSLPI